jgi:transposase
MGKKVQYPSEIKWEAIKMKSEGYTTSQVMKKLNVKNKSQIMTWMRWYKKGETHRFEQGVGKQYTFNKGIGELSEVEALKLRVKQLEMENELLGKLKRILRK